MFLQVLMMACFMTMANSFDLWKLIEKANENGTTSDGVLNDDNPIFTIGDISFDRTKVKVFHSPNTKKYEHPYFDWHYKVWKREIPYVIGRGLGKARGKIQEALQIIEKASCLRFRRKYSSDDNWIEYYYGKGCHSGIGRKYWKRAPTRISLGNYCDFPPIIVHETLHALGFYHEQSRPDRDSYVRVYTNRIANGMKSNFDKREFGESNYFGTEYDYKSIMHYSRMTFSKDHKLGNVIEAKFDPNMLLGRAIMSATDKEELNKLYKCHVKSGWSEWSDWSICIASWRKDCTRAKVRYCVSLNWKECPGANKFGAQNIIEECPYDKCKNFPIDGHWGNWGEFSKCTSSCGWGMQTRSRKCNNPVPKNGGQDCYGQAVDRYLCRNPRCGGPIAADNDFENGAKQWTMKVFRIVSGRVSATSGPKRDRTGISKGIRGHYAVASKTNPDSFKPKRASLISPWIQPYGKKMCISFYYQLNGVDIHRTNALSVYLLDSKKSYTNFAFMKGGHQGNFWKRAALEISPQKLPFKIGIEARFKRFGRSDIAVDDIFFDHNPCPEGLNVCKDMKTDCKKQAENGYCRTNWRYMMLNCCQTCQDPKFHKVKPKKKCRNKDKTCPSKAVRGKCNDKKILNDCCRSCKAVNFVRSCTSQKNYHTKCEYWAKKNECEKNPWMGYNCCPACKKFMVLYTKQAVPCSLSAVSGQCSDKKILKNCARECKAVRTVKTCNSKKNNHTKCEYWAQRNECERNPWMGRNCCPACKKFMKPPR